MSLNQDQKRNLRLLCVFSLSIFLLKLSFWPAAFLYPYIFYRLLKDNSFWLSTALGFIMGIIYFWTLFLWFTTTGIELNLLGGIASGVIFGLSALLFKSIEHYIYPHISLLEKIDVVIWPICFFAIQHAVFPIFLDATYLLDVPPFLTFLYFYIGSGGVHLAISIFSIWCGRSFEQKNKSSLIISAGIILTLLIIQALFVYLPNTQDTSTARVALVQVNNTQEIHWKREHAQTTYNQYRERITQAAQNGAEIIIMPENAILFWSETINKKKVLQELSSISSNHDSYIIFSTLERNPEHQKLESRGYVIDPKLGVQRPYVAHKTYDYIGNDETFALGTETVLYKTPYGTLRLLICFEALFRDELGKDDLSEYDHIIVMANNQFLPSHNGLKTLEWNAQDIAGTYKKNVLYASNNGPTLLANKYGKTKASLPYDTTDILWVELDLPR